MAVIAVASAVLLGVLALGVRLHPRNGIDRYVFEHFRAHDSELLRWARQILAVAGSAFAIAVTTGAICRLAWWRWRSRGRALLPIAVVTTSAITADHLLKPTVDRRPLPKGAIASWPSGTMAVWSGLAVVCLILLAVHHGRLRWRDTASSAATLIVLTLGFILTGDHYLSDVVGGCLLGLVMALTLSLVLTGARRSGPPAGDVCRGSLERAAQRGHTEANRDR